MYFEHHLNIGKLDYKLISDVKFMIWNIVFSLIANSFKNLILVFF